MDKNTITLAKYLLTKGVDSSLQIQKLLFFIRVEELKNKVDNGFFEKNNNFQAWIYGPVNPESFYHMQKYFNSEEEAEEFFLSKEQTKEIDKIYSKYLVKYIDFSPAKLVSESHKNISWINARGDLDQYAPSKTYMKEDETFIQFKN